VAAELGGKTVFTGDKLREPCDMEGNGHKNRSKSGVIP